MKKEIQEELARLRSRLGDLGKGASPAELKDVCIRIYNQLCILEYLENKIEGGPQTQASISFDSKSYREQNWFVEPEPVPRPEHQEELVEPLMEKIKDIVAQMPGEGEQVDALLERLLPTERKSRIEIEEIAAEYQQMPVFERKELQEEQAETLSESRREEPSVRSLNERLSTGIKIGLNDKHAIVNQLFQGNLAFYQEALRSISSMNSFMEVQKYLKESVKPKFDNWAGKEEYEERFLSLLERGFN